MSSVLVLALPNFELTFEVESDASNARIGIVLSQIGKSITFYSKALSPKHQVLSVYENEMLAILSTIKNGMCIYWGGISKYALIIST